MSYHSKTPKALAASEACGAAEGASSLSMSTLGQRPPATSAAPLTFEAARFWDGRRNQAAQLLAEGKLSDEQIAVAVGRSRRWLAHMKRQPEFQERVRCIVVDTAAALKAEGIANRQARIDDGVALHSGMRQIIEERAAEEEWAKVPGWKSGLLVHSVKQVGTGRDAVKVDVFEFDAALVHAINANKKQVAQEAGQWSERRELTGKDGGPIKGEFTWSDLVRLAAEEDAR